MVFQLASGPATVGRMSSPAESLTPEDALAALVWQIEMGADEAILDAPVDRYEQAAARPPRRRGPLRPSWFPKPFGPRPRRSAWRWPPPT